MLVSTANLIGWFKMKIKNLFPLAIQLLFHQNLCGMFIHTLNMKNIVDFNLLFKMWPRPSQKVLKNLLITKILSICSYSMSKLMFSIFLKKIDKSLWEFVEISIWKKTVNFYVILVFDGVTFRRQCVRVLKK